MVIVLVCEACKYKIIKLYRVYDQQLEKNLCNEIINCVSFERYPKNVDIRIFKCTLICGVSEFYFINETGQEVRTV